MASIGTLVTNTIANVAPFQKGMRKMASESKKTSKGLGLLKSAASSLGLALGVGGLLGGIRKLISLYSIQQDAEAQLAAAMRSTGRAAGLSAEEIKKFAAARQSMTRFGDEVTIQGASILATFTNIRKGAFKPTMVAAQDMATRMGTDLQSAVVMLGKALNDPIANLSALSRAGVQFSKDQKVLIKTLAETGKLLDAQKLILDELETQFGGSAAAAAGTYAGQMKQLSDKFGDLGEQLGEKLVPRLLLITRFLNEAVEWAQKLGFLDKEEVRAEVPQMQQQRRIDATQENADQLRDTIAAQRTNRAILAQEINDLKSRSLGGWALTALPFGGMAEKAQRDEERARKTAELRTLDRAIRLNEQLAVDIEAEQTPENIAKRKQRLKEEEDAAAATVEARRAELFTRLEDAEDAEKAAGIWLEHEKERDVKGEGRFTRRQEFDIAEMLREANETQKEVLAELRDLRSE